MNASCTHIYGCGYCNRRSSSFETLLFFYCYHLKRTLSTEFSNMHWYMYVLHAHIIIIWIINIGWQKNLYSFRGYNNITFEDKGVLPEYRTGIKKPDKRHFHIDQSPCVTCNRFSTQHWWDLTEKRVYFEWHLVTRLQLSYAKSHIWHKWWIRQSNMKWQINWIC